MATPASSARGPPASQVTASVVKFRCLFTHDLRRKSKRWQDGYLRYHAFNKRIMVYDEQANFIGDHHWRSVDEVQDGDELELEKGVLIEVGERMSTTQTDLSNLFEKRSQGSPSSNTQASQVPRTSTPARSSGSSQPFRSLNDLLGIRKTPIGHLVSPYEERHRPPPPSNIAVPSEPERPPKRQKVATPRNTAMNNKKTEVVDLTRPERGPSDLNQVGARPAQEMPRPHKSMPSIPLPENPRKETVPKPQKPKAPAVSMVPPPLENPRKETVPKPQEPKTPAISMAPPPLQSKSSTGLTPKVPGRIPAKEPLPEQPPKRNPPSRNVQDIQDDDWEAPIKTMRMTMQKPRKKLMYSALLPSEKPQKPSPPPSISRTENRSQSVPKAAEAEAPSQPALEENSTNAEYIPSDSTQCILEEMVNGSISQPEPNQLPRNSKANPPLSALHNIPTRRALDAPLRKSLSDPTALTARPSLQARPTLARSALSNAEEAEPHEEGPWTSEALDLFDFWPAGRPKPGQ